MTKADHGKRLRAAMAAKGFPRDALAEAVSVNVRTVTNWTTGATMPSDRERAALRKLFPGYDTAGDPVEIALRQSELTTDRQTTVIGFYQRLLREQREAAVS